MNVSRAVARLKARTRRRSRLRQAGALVAGFGLGVGSTFFLDPQRGARRRALVRDKAVHAAHRAGDLFDKGWRDLGYRLTGLAATVRSRRRHESVPDELLVERVRAKMGRCVSHPHAIEVSAHEGVVRLGGPILARDVAPLLACVTSVPGVNGVEDRLEVHVAPDAVPALQGGTQRSGHRFELRQERWSPITRIALGLAGLSLAGYGIKRRDRVGVLAATAGAAILLRDVENRPLGKVLGVRAGRRAVDIQKSVHVRAPVDDVFELFMNLERFPRFMGHLYRVERRGEGRYHWVAAGPVGLPVSWDAEVTEVVPNRCVAWKSVPGSIIKNAGIVRFEADPEGGTRVDIRMSYNPPGGALGHAIAKIFGADPKHAMDEDLVRFQSMLEQGKTTAHGHPVRFADVAG